jgi:hypothetical protein
LDNNSAVSSGVIGLLFLIYAVVILALVVFSVWIYWRIFAKAGFNGAMSLLNLIPGVGQLICVLILAFGRWPIEDQLDAMRAGVPAGTTMPPPGTSMMPS